MNKFKLVTILAFFAIYFIWGSTYIGIRFAMETIPPYFMFGFRFTISGLLLYFIAYLQNPQIPSLADWKKASITGFIMVFFGYLTLAWAQQNINSGLAALIVASIPIWIILLDWLFVSGTRPSKLTLFGVGLGLFGVSLLSGVDEGSLLNPSISIGTAIVSCLVLLMGSIGWAAGSLYIKKINFSVPIQYLVGMQMIIGGFGIFLFGFTQNEWNLLSVERISLQSIVALSYLIVFGTLLGHSAYFWLLRNNDPAKVATYALFNPVVALILGCVLADEVINLKIILGAIAILLAVTIINRPFKKRKRHVILQIDPEKI